MTSEEQRAEEQQRREEEEEEELEEEELETEDIPDAYGRSYLLCGTARGCAEAVERRILFLTEHDHFLSHVDYLVLLTSRPRILLRSRRSNPLPPSSPTPTDAPPRDKEFIEDDFNLTGLSALVPFYKEAMEMVLDVEAEEESHKIPDVSIVESSAELLYGLIHQRFIITRQGLQSMVRPSLPLSFLLLRRRRRRNGKLSMMMK